MQCISETEIDIPYEPAKYSIISHPVPNQPIRAILGYSSIVTDNFIAPQDTTPKVYIFSGDSEFDNIREYLDDNTNESYWQTTRKAKADSTYIIRIVHPDFPFDTISAQTTIPHPIKVEVAADMESIPATVIAGRIVKQIPIAITADDIWESDSLFAVCFSFVRYNLVGQDLREAPARFIAPGSTLSNLHVSPDNSILIEKKLWKNNFPRTLNLTLVVDYLDEYEVPESLNIEWRTVSPEYYNYYLSVARQGNISLPFNDPDILYNNVKGGYGTFSGYSIYTVKIDL